MITVTEKEYKKMVSSAEDTLIVKCMLANIELKKGEDIDRLAQPIAVAHCNLISLYHYDTGRFNPEEYFNILDPAYVVKNYSSINTVKL